MGRNVCTAVKVQPKEGDTADRAKCYQVGGLGVRNRGYTPAFWGRGRGISKREECFQLHSTQGAAKGGRHSRRGNAVLPGEWVGR